mmetsp:Transcript_78874/g.223493  ORF Transcript_78874/g.223493 Transcript_78874/m.223493 type:complete len:881 (-) Transcript_78874:115-2757(-)
MHLVPDDGAGFCGGELSMADLSQQTYALNGQLSQDGSHRSALACDRLQEPLRVESPHHRQSEVAAVAAGQPMRVQQSPQLSPQLLQMAAAGSRGLAGDAQAEHLQKMLTEVFRQFPGVGEAPAFAGAGAAPSGTRRASQDAGAGAGGSPGRGYGCWGQQAAAEEPPCTDHRVEELNRYIRQQAQEHIESQAECSRQIAVVRSECSRELAKVKREKAELERQARQETLRLQQLLRDAGIEDKASPRAASDGGGAEAPARAAAGAEEFQQVHRKWTAAEERIRQLEQYIKDQSAKQIRGGHDPLARERDDEVRKLRQALIATGAELRQTSGELRALRARSRQKALLWESGASRLAASAGAFLEQGLWGPRCGADGEELENGHFGRTATKLSLTLSQGGDDDVSALRRLLKDVLRNGKEKSGKRPAQKAREEPQAKPDDAAPAALEGSAAKGAVSAKADDAKLEEAGKGNAEVDAPSMPWSVTRRPMSGSVSDSNLSSRDTSPGREQADASPLQVLPNDASSRRASPRRPGGGSAPSARVVQFLSQLSGELRQLVAMSQQLDDLGVDTCVCPSQDASPRSTGGAGATSSPAGHQARLTALLDGVGPARKNITQSVITVERALRVLERDLRRQCDEVFGQVELEASGEADWPAGAAGEAEQRVPISEEQQRASLAGLRLAQRRAGAVLEELVRLPQSLKVVFDATKQLAIEIGGGALATSGPSSPSCRPPPSPAAALGPQVMPGTDPLQQEAGKEDEEVAARETREELGRGVSHEEQCIAARAAGMRLARLLASREERLRTMEREMADLHTSRQAERALVSTVMQQHQQQLSQWPLTGLGAGYGFEATSPAHDAAEQAWGLPARGLPEGSGEWPGLPPVDVAVA